MKKNFKSYALIWAIFLLLFNVIVFLVRPIIPNYEIHYDARFWIAWLFVTAAFVGNLLCAIKEFQAENLEKLFYKLPLITVSYTGLTVMLLLGGALMLIPNCPAWISAVVCVAAAGFTAVAVVKADWAADTVEATEKNVKEKTVFIRLKTVEAENLMVRAKTDEAKGACKKVYEALRYSDPMSSDALADIEAEISEKLSAYAAAVNSGENVSELADELLSLIGDRNRMCKVMK